MSILLRFMPLNRLENRSIPSLGTSGPGYAGAACASAAHRPPPREGTPELRVPSSPPWVLAQGSDGAWYNHGAAPAAPLPSHGMCCWSTLPRQGQGARGDSPHPLGNADIHLNLQRAALSQPCHDPCPIPRGSIRGSW